KLHSTAEIKIVLSQVRRTRSADKTLLQLCSRGAGRWRLIPSSASVIHASNSVLCSRDKNGVCQLLSEQLPYFPQTLIAFFNSTRLSICSKEFRPEQLGKGCHIGASNCFGVRVRT